MVSCIKCKKDFIPLSTQQEKSANDKENILTDKENILTDKENILLESVASACQNLSFSPSSFSSLSSKNRSEVCEECWRKTRINKKGTSRRSINRMRTEIDDVKSDLNQFFCFKINQEKLNKEVKSGINKANERISDNQNSTLQTLNQHTKDIKQTKEEVKNLKENTLSLTLKDIEKDQEEKLKILKNFYLAEKDDWYIDLTKKQKERIEKEDNPNLLEAYVREILKTHQEIEEIAQNTIYRWKDSPKHQICWPPFLILAAVAIKWVRKINKKKPKPTATIQEEVQEKFDAWKLNMYLSVVAYFVSFFLLQGIIDKWIRPNIYRWLESDKNFTTTIIVSALGFLFLADGVITSELKTPLQRLSVKIESANISEKEKKELLSKTQQSNETFKETLKRFGLLSIAGTAIKLLGDHFDKNPLALLCYIIPLSFGVLRIIEVSRAIKKDKWKS